MNATKRDIEELPWEWALHIAEQSDPDWARHYVDPYEAISAAWPYIKGDVEDALDSTVGGMTEELPNE